MTTEFQLVVVRPEYEDGKDRKRVYPKRDLAHAEKGLADWVRDMERYRAVGLEAWRGHIETRQVTVTPWVRVAVAAPVDWGGR